MAVQCLQTAACGRQFPGETSAAPMQLLSRVLLMRGPQSVRPMQSKKRRNGLQCERVEIPSCGPTRVSRVCKKSKGYWQCQRCAKQKPASEFTSWRAGKKYAQNGSQECNACIVQDSCAVRHGVR